MRTTTTAQTFRPVGIPSAQTARLPAARPVTLPGRGTTSIHESTRRPDAPTVVLLHGLGATASSNWFTAFPMLEQRCHVVAPDHRGHGRGIPVGAPFTLEQCADDVVALADRLGIARFYPVGYSMGGAVAQLIWRRHPDRVAGLVLCATACRFRGTSREHALFAALPALDWVERDVLRRDPSAVLQAAMQLGKYSAKEWIGEIDVPTSVIVHTRDQVVPPRRQLELASAVPGAAVHFIGAGHSAAVRDPVKFVPALLSAIEDVAFTCSSSTALREAS